MERATPGTGLDGSICLRKRRLQPWNVELAIPFLGAELLDCQAALCWRRTRSRQSCVKLRGSIPRHRVGSWEGTK